MTARYTNGLIRQFPKGLGSLRLLLKEMRGPADAVQTLPDGRFPGGLVGYVCYDAVRDFEEIPDSHPATRVPTFRFVLPQALCVYDNFRQELRLTCFASGHNITAVDARAATRELLERIDVLETCLRRVTVQGARQCCAARHT